jgi:hypothetical protein
MGARVVADVVRIPLAGGGVVLVEPANPGDDGPVKAGRLGERVQGMSATLQELLEPITGMAEAVLDHLSRARPSELEVEFGIALTAEAGAVITKSALSGNLKVTMKWRRGEYPTEGPAGVESA